MHVKCAIPEQQHEATVVDPAIALDSSGWFLCAASVAISLFPRPLVLLLLWLVVVCNIASVTILSCKALSSSCHAGQVLRVAAPLVSYPVVPPSHPLVACVTSA